MKLSVCYVYGIGNKPTPTTLNTQLNQALFSSPIAPVPSAVVDWLDHKRYPTPEPAESIYQPPSSKIQWAMRQLHSLNGQPHLPQALWTLAERLGGRKLLDGMAVRITKKYLPDVYDVLYNVPRRTEILNAFVSSIGPEPTIVIAHSIGTVISYMGLLQTKTPVPLWLTVGSPLGLRQVQDALGGSLTRPPWVQRWVNLAERTDIVAADGNLLDDVAGVENVQGLGINTTAPAHPHSFPGYLQSPVAREAVGRAIRISRMADELVASGADEHGERMTVLDEDSCNECNGDPSPGSTCSVCFRIG